MARLGNGEEIDITNDEVECYDNASASQALWRIYEFKLHQITSNGMEWKPMAKEKTVISLNAHQSKLYFLRMLLHHQTGATNFADLRTVEEEEQKHSILADDILIKIRPADPGSGPPGLL